LRIRSRLTAWTWAPYLLWILAIGAIPAWNAVDAGNGRGAKAVLYALKSTEAGRDPYLDGMAAQDSYRALQPQGTPPYLYVYSPITLPLLGSVCWDTGHFSSALFALFYHLYAIPLFVYLVYLSRQFLAGKFSLERWVAGACSSGRPW